MTPDGLDAICASPPPPLCLPTRPHVVCRPLPCLPLPPACPPFAAAAVSIRNRGGGGGSRGSERAGSLTSASSLASQLSLRAGGSLSLSLGGDGGVGAADGGGGSAFASAALGRRASASLPASASDAPASTAAAAEAAASARRRRKKSSAPTRASDGLQVRCLLGLLLLLIALNACSGSVACRACFPPFPCIQQTDPLPPPACLLLPAACLAAPAAERPLQCGRGAADAAGGRCRRRWQRRQWRVSASQHGGMRRQMPVRLGVLQCN